MCNNKIATGSYYMCVDRWHKRWNDRPMKQAISRVTSTWVVSLWYHRRLNRSSKRHTCACPDLSRRRACLHMPCQWPLTCTFIVPREDWAVEVDDGGLWSVCARENPNLITANTLHFPPKSYTPEYIYIYFFCGCMNTYNCTRIHFLGNLHLMIAYSHCRGRVIN